MPLILRPINSNNILEYSRHGIIPFLVRTSSLFPAVLHDDEGHDREGEEDGGEVDGGGDGGRDDEAGHDHLRNRLCSDQLSQLLLLSKQHQEAAGISIVQLLLYTNIRALKYIDDFVE